ncbi:MAG: helix-turn-helix domain-containing protein [Noviherbaspirillum sp.]
MKIDQRAAIAPHLEQLLKETGASLARMRIARRMPQRLAAERAGISRNTLSRIENGDPSVAIGQVMRYLETLGKGEVLARALESESDPAVRSLAVQEKTRRARALSETELERYDF